MCQQKSLKINKKLFPFHILLALDPKSLYLENFNQMENKLHFEIMSQWVICHQCFIYVINFKISTNFISIAIANAIAWMLYPSFGLSVWLSIWVCVVYQNRSIESVKQASIYLSIDSVRSEKSNWVYLWLTISIVKHHTSDC